MTTETVTLPFTPRKWQVPVLDCEARHIVAVVHRRAGKTTLFQWRGLKKALTEDRRHLPPAKRHLRTNPPRVIHVLPSAIMWKRTGMWDSLVRAATSIPGAQVAIGDKRVLLPNGGVYQTGGMDEPDRWRGGYADLVIEDEADDVSAGGLDMVVVPMLADFSGQRAKIGTPKGNGRLAAAYDAAGEDPDNSRRFLLGWQATGIFTPEQIAEIRRDLDPDEFEQEFNCSFTAPNSGSYYGKWLDLARAEERITRVLYDPTLPVHTCWDLGMDDSTAIWWFQRSPGGEWRWLEYHEDTGQGFDAYARLILNKPYTYGKHYLPHDIEVRELGSGKSRRQTLQNLGVRPISVVPAANPAERVAASRMIMPRSWFDAKGCEMGLKRLRGYRRSWNEHMGVWRAEPVHDESSHGADAFGTGVQGSRSPENETRRMPSPMPMAPRETGGGSWMGV